MVEIVLLVQGEFIRAAATVTVKGRWQGCAISFHRGLLEQGNPEFLKIPSRKIRIFRVEQQPIAQKKGPSKMAGP